jgi:site-specific recombinase XerD
VPALRLRRADRHPQRYGAVHHRVREVQLAGRVHAAHQRATYAAALLGSEPDRVSGWITFVWGGKSAKTFNIRLTALASACGYWRAQGWLAGDPLVRLRARPAPPDISKALSRDRVAEILGSDAALRERVLWHMLYESSARARRC